METFAMNGKQWFDSMLGDISYEPDSQAGKLYPFFVRVGCVKRRPPRHEFFQWFVDMGRPLIDAVMNHDYIEGGSLAFVFPERWMGVAEQQAFTHCLAKHPEVDSITQVDIITSAPLLISSFMADQIRILTWPDDEGLYNGSPENKD